MMFAKTGPNEEPIETPTSYPGSFFGKDPGVGWSRDSN